MSEELFMEEVRWAESYVGGILAMKKMVILWANARIKELEDSVKTYSRLYLSQQGRAIQMQDEADALRSSLALKETEIERLKEAVEWILSGDADLTDFKKFCAELRRRAYGEGNNL